MKIQNLSSVFTINNNRSDPENPVINEDLSIYSVPSYKSNIPASEEKKKLEELPTYEDFVKFKINKY